MRWRTPGRGNLSKRSIGLRVAAACLLAAGGAALGLLQSGEGLAFPPSETECSGALVAFELSVGGDGGGDVVYLVLDEGPVPFAARAGEPFDLEIRAVDECGDTVDYEGSATLSGLGTAPDGTLPDYDSFDEDAASNVVTFYYGYASTSVTPFLAETAATITATADDPEATGTSAPFDVLPGPAFELRVDPIDDTEKNELFDVTVRAFDEWGNATTVDADTDVAFSLHSCAKADPPPAGAGCTGVLGGETAAVFPAGSGIETFSLSYSTPQNFVRVTADDVPEGEAADLEPGTSDPFNVFDVLVTRTLEGATTFGTECTDATPADPVCLTVKFPGGASGTASALEANCADGTGEECLAAIGGLTGDFSSATWRLVLEYDKSISGNRGVSSFTFTYSIALGEPQTPVNKCKKKGKPNAGEKMCLDRANRNGAGDTVFEFVGVGDPFVKGK